MFRLRAPDQLLPEFDMLLLMTVEPGFGGQPFLDLVLPKIRRARELISAADLQVWLQVDGGVDARTIERCAEAFTSAMVPSFARRDRQQHGSEILVHSSTLVDSYATRHEIMEDRDWLRSRSSTWPGGSPSWSARRRSASASGRTGCWANSG